MKYVPSPVGNPMRRAVLALVCAECRVPPFWIRTGIDIWWPGNIRVGRSSLNENVFLNGYGGITIGDHCLIARGACFFSGGHTFDRADILIVEQPLARAPIVVEDDVYFGLNCIILGGIHIGRGAIIGAGSVVTDSVPSGAIVAGVPARVIRFRDGYIQHPKTLLQTFRDHLFAPLRLTVLSDEMCEAIGVTSVNAERIAYVLPFVRGRLLDVGCGRNFLVAQYDGGGVGVDVFDWRKGALIVEDTSRLPFRTAAFDTVTILAALNHIVNREAVLREVHRVLKDDGQLVLTMIPPGLSAIGHKLLWWHGEDWARGMSKGEVYGFDTATLTALVSAQGFMLERHNRFLYRLNNLYVFRKATA